MKINKSQTSNTLQFTLFNLTSPKSGMKDSVLGELPQVFTDEVGHQIQIKLDANVNFVQQCHREMFEGGAGARPNGKARSSCLGH